MSDAHGVTSDISRLWRDGPVCVMCCCALWCRSELSRLALPSLSVVKQPCSLSVKHSHMFRVGLVLNLLCWVDKDALCLCAKCVVCIVACFRYLLMWSAQSAMVMSSSVGLLSNAGHATCLVGGCVMGPQM